MINTNKSTHFQPKVKFKPKYRFIALGALTLFFLYALQPYSRVSVTSQQMEMTPILNPGEMVYLYKHSDINQYQVGDILLYRVEKKTSSNEARFQWGTLLGKNGDHISIKNGKVIYPEQTTYPTMGLPPQLQKNFPTIGPDAFFIVHRQQTSPVKDSLTEGAIPFKHLNIKGKLFFQPNMGP
jgi:hypothetical protein